METIQNKKHISMDRKRPFVARNGQIKDAMDYLFDSNDNGSVVLVVQGDSGTGKTYFTKELMRRVIKKYNSQMASIYIDVSQDLFESSLVTSYILKQTIVPSKASFDYPVNILKDQTITAFRNIRKKKQLLKNGVVSIIPHVLKTIGGIGSSLEKALSTSLPVSEEFSEDEELFCYLKWISQKGIVSIIIDNYQFLNIAERLSLGAIFQRIKNNLKIVLINRTIDNHSTLSSPVCSIFPICETLSLKKFTFEQTLAFVQCYFEDNGEYLTNLAKDIQIKSLGLPKDIQFCLDKYLLEIKKGIKPGEIQGLLTTIDRLPEMHRQFLLIVALLNGGLKKTIIQNSIRRMNSIVDDSEIETVYKDLIAWEYLKIKTSSIDRIGPGHERIIQAMMKIVDDEFHEKVRSSLIEELSIAIKTGNFNENEAYLLHCLVGLHTTRELLDNIHYITRLVRTQYRLEQFSYLTTLGDEFEKDVLQVLPVDLLSMFLDSYQKTSQFDNGLNFINRLKQSTQQEYNFLYLYKFKFLIQLYQYKQALSISNKVKDDMWKAVYQINASLALSDEKKAIEIAKKIVLKPENSEAYAVFLRNTITLCSKKQALINLKKSKSYFEKRGSDFRIATVLNNIGLVFLWAGELENAEKYFEKSIQLFEFVGSQEIFQPSLNMGITYAVKRDFQKAIAFLDKTYEEIPVALILDRVKFQMNKIVFQILADQMNTIEAIAALNSLLNIIKGIEMPYIRETLKFNIAQANYLLGKKEDPPNPKFISGSSNHVSIQKYLPNDNHTSTGGWILTMSIHWRY